MIARGVAGLTVSVVIPCRNSMETLVQTLESLRGEISEIMEIIVVDDGSSRAIEYSDPQIPVEVIRLDPGRGPAAARNTGARKARGDIILFIDADVLIFPGAIRRVKDHFQWQTDLTAVQGIYTPDTPARGFFSRFQNYYYHHAFMRMPRTDIAVCATFCFAVLRQIFLDTGGFDESIRQPTVEDEAYGYILSAKGYRIILDPEVAVTHLATYTASGFLRRKFRMSFYQVQHLLRGMRPPIPVAGRSNRTHHSRGVLLSVLLAPLIPAVLIINPLAGMVPITIYALVNFDFWWFVGRHDGFCMVPAAIPVTLLDHLTIFCGLATGTWQHFLGSMSGSKPQK